MLHHKPVLSPLLLMIFVFFSSNRVHAEELKPHEKTRLQWVKKAALVKKGMSWAQLQKLLPNHDGGMIMFGDGGGSVVMYSLDKHFTVRIEVRSATKEVLSAPRIFGPHEVKRKQPSVASKKVAASRLGARASSS